MIILFTNIPTDFYHDNIRSLIQPVIKGGLFKPQGTISGVEIIALKENDDDALEYQALVNIEPETVAHRAIKSLHRMNVRGYRIMVRQYFTRNSENDKRRTEPDPASSFNEKRTNSCRRRDLKVYKIAFPEYQ